MNKFMGKCIAVTALAVLLLSLGGCAGEKRPPKETRAVQTTVVEIERFGHAVLDITSADLAAAGYELGDVVCVRIGTFESSMPFFDGYYTSPGSLLLRGSTPESKVAVCINYGDFSKEMGIAPGDAAEITMAEKGGMRDLQELCALQYSNDPASYADNTVFANFRAVTAGRIGQGKLYRSASPINDLMGRAAYANDLIADAGVATVLNLADSYEELDAYCQAEDFHSAYYRDLYQSGQVMALDLAGNFFAEEFAADLAEGFTFLAHKAPPYCIHCTEGKDRAGFTAMLLEALMGASLDEITADYMLSFRNYYGIDKEKEPERYQTVLDINLIPMLCHVTGAGTAEELAQIDLEAAVTDYLLNAGMAEGDILLLKEKLS